MKEAHKVSNDGCEFSHVVAIAAANLYLLSFAPKLILTQSSPLLCRSYCILFFGACLIFFSIYKVQKRQRLLMLGVSDAKTAKNQDTALHVLGWLLFFNCIVGFLLFLVGLAAQFHPDPLHPFHF
jgi:site-specific recombinase